MCRRGPTHSFVFLWKLRRRNVCLPAVLGSEGDRREKGELTVRLTSSHLLLESIKCVYMCVRACILVGGGHTMPPPPSALTSSGLSCIFNPSNARLSVVLSGGTLLKSVAVSRPSLSVDNGSTRGFLNALRKQERMGVEREDVFCLFRDFLRPGFLQHVCLFVCSCRKMCVSGWLSSLEVLFWKHIAIGVMFSGTFPVYCRNDKLLTLAPAYNKNISWPL